MHTIQYESLIRSPKPAWAARNMLNLSQSSVISMSGLQHLQSAQRIVQGIVTTSIGQPRALGAAHAELGSHCLIICHEQEGTYLAIRERL